MPGSLQSLPTLALKYARMQHRAALAAKDDPHALRQHIARTLCRCLPACIVTDALIDACQRALRTTDAAHDPMYTGAIHAFAGNYLRAAANSGHPLMQRLHRSALRLLPSGRDASRDELRLVTLDALYDPKLLPPGESTAYIRHRLGLGSGIPLSCEEIALRMHRPLVYIHELEAALLTTLSSHYTGGHHA